MLGEANRCSIWTLCRYDMSLLPVEMANSMATGTCNPANLLVYTGVTGCPTLLGPPCQMAVGLPLLGDSASASSLSTGFLLLDRVEDWVPALNSSNPVMFTNLSQHQGVLVEGLAHRRFRGVKCAHQQQQMQSVCQVGRPQHDWYPSKHTTHLLERSLMLISLMWDAPWRQ